MIILEAERPVSRSVQSYGSSTLRDDFGELTHRSLLHARQSRSIFEWAYTRLAQYEYQLSTKTGQYLYLARAGEIIRDAFAELRAHVQTGLTESGYVVRGAYSLNYPVLASTDDDIESLSRQWVDRTRHGRTLTSRFTRRAAMAQRYLSYALPQYEKRPESFRRFLKSFFLGDVTGWSPTAAGSLFQYGQLATFTEMQAFKRSFSRRILLAHGVQFVHWRLGGLHKWYGGQEICEIHAGQISNAAGVPAGVSRQGLFTIEDTPPHPHPNCACHLEPII